MTLAEVLPIAQQLTALEKLRLIRILAEELDAQSNSTVIESGHTYHVYTPLDQYGVAEELLKAFPSGSKPSSAS